MKPRKNYPLSGKQGILLDIGCRDRKEKNFVGIDVKPGKGIDIVWDIYQKFPYPLKSESVLTIKCAHVLEHVPPWLVVKFMDEMWRMLLRGGQMALSAPFGVNASWMQDPTHCTVVTDRTFQHFDPKYALFARHNPCPWGIEHISWKLSENIEVILRKQDR